MYQQINNTTPVWISSPTPNVKTSIDDQCRRQEYNDGVMKVKVVM